MLRRPFWRWCNTGGLLCRRFPTSLKDPFDILDLDVLLPLFEASKPWEYGVGLGYSRYLLVHPVALRSDDGRDIQVGHLVVDSAFHQGPPVVIFDEPDPAALRHRNLLRESLLLEEPDGVVVGVREEVLDALALHMLLQVIHHSPSVPFDLFLPRDGKENDLREFLRMERPDDNAADCCPLSGCAAGLNQAQGAMVPVHDQSRDVLLWHLGELLRDDVLQVN
mmetsp:Transcript_14518/g.35383  ORF Transcript_14518/g.35383 Transcript_14518/m.35383 type:complete len:222 (-) Transcript_14518:634-1299(-)